MFPQISKNWQENTCIRVSFLNKVADLRPETLLKKETLIQVFSCQYFEICENTFLQNTFGRLLLSLEPWQISMIELFYENSKSLTVFLKSSIIYVFSCIVSKITWRYSSSCLQMFFKIGVLKNFANFTGKHQRWNLFLIKLKVLNPATLLKKTRTQVFSCEIC